MLMKMAYSRIKMKNATFLWQSFDNSVDDEKETTSSGWNRFSVYDLSKNTYDRLGTSIKRLSARFGIFLRRKQVPNTF